MPDFRISFTAREVCEGMLSQINVKIVAFFLLLKMFRFPSEPDFEGRWKAEVKNGDKFFILMTGTNMENFPVSKDDSVNIARFETTVKKGGISC